MNNFLVPILKQYKTAFTMFFDSLFHSYFSNVKIHSVAVNMDHYMIDRLKILPLCIVNMRIHGRILIPSTKFMKILQTSSFSLGHHHESN
jgi:hypothetical protein